MAFVKCSSCGFSKKVDDSHIGKRAKCPKCKEQITVSEDPPFKQPKAPEINQNIHHNNTPSPPQNNELNEQRWFYNPLLKNIAIAFICLVTILSFTSFLDNKSDEYCDKALKQAAASFAVSKTLNGIISIVQDIDFSANFGVGMTVGMGEGLDPVNDIIEKFSYIMFASTISLGIQKIISKVGRCSFVKIFLSLVSALLILSLLMNQKPAINIGYSLVMKLFLILVVLRFAMPVVSYINDQVYISIIQQNLAIEEGKITILADEISGLDLFDYFQTTDSQAPHEVDPDDSPKVSQTRINQESGVLSSMGKIWQSTLEKSGDAYQQATESVSEKFNDLKQSVSPAAMKKRIDKLTKKTSEASTYLMNLAVIFVFQTIVSPLIVLWGLLKGTGFIMNNSF